MFYGIFESLSFELGEQKNAPKEQTVALNLVAKDVKLLQKNIASILLEVDDSGVSDKLRNHYEKVFGAYSPMYNKFGPDKTNYSRAQQQKCIQWCENPKENKQKLTQLWNL